MTPEQQRIALAKWSGFKPCPTTDHPEIRAAMMVAPDGRRMVPPNYLSDLNAVHELEKNLKGTQWYNYRINLEDILAMECDKSSGLIPAVFHATASQRCEAMLKTLNLWTD